MPERICLKEYGMKDTTIKTFREILPLKNENGWLSVAFNNEIAVRVHFTIRAPFKSSAQ